jgi:hypothetical protein
MKDNRFVPLIVTIVMTLAIVFLVTSYLDTSDSPTRMSDAPSGSAPAPK